MANEGTRMLCANALKLLKVDGLLTFVLRLPASTGWDLPSLQAYVDRSLASVIHQFWLSGWLSHRFEHIHTGWLDARGLPLTTATHSTVVSVRVVLRKVETSYRDRAIARASRQDFGLPEEIP